MTDLMLPLAIFDAAEFFGWFVENANYLLVFVFMMIESSFIPFPSEVVVPPAAYLAAQSGHEMNVAGVVLAATAGAVAGAFINYLLALWIGRPLVYRFADSRIGHACLLDREKVQHAEKYFDEHGAVSTFVGRLIPAVRQLISIPAGLARMNIGMFALFTALGAAVWNSVLAGLGWWLGHTVPLSSLFEQVERYNSYLSWVGLGVLLLCVAVILYNAFKKHDKKMILAPSLLAADFLHIGREVEMVNESDADWLHLDVMDGSFVPNISFGFPVIEAVARVSCKPLDVHLMVERPEQWIERLAACGAEFMNVHVEAVRHLHRVVEAIRSAGMRPAVTLCPATPVCMLEDIIADVDMVLLMSVNPGFGGQKFIPSTVEKIERLRSLIERTGSKALIEVDGGINRETALAVARAGADALVAGTSVFRAADPQAEAAYYHGL